MATQPEEKYPIQAAACYGEARSLVDQVEEGLNSAIASMEKQIAEVLDLPESETFFLHGHQMAKIIVAMNKAYNDGWNDHMTYSGGGVVYLSDDELGALLRELGSGQVGNDPLDMALRKIEAAAGQ